MGLDREHLDRLPHQLSGGELQRLALARILLLQPSFIVADEPTSRLDISVQARIVRMIAGLVETEGLSVLLISHDLGPGQDGLPPDPGRFTPKSGPRAQPLDRVGPD